MSTVQEDAKNVIQELSKLKYDKGAMSILRKGLSDALEFKTYKYISRMCNIENTRMRTIVKHIAAFYATHPENVCGKNFGQSIRELALKKDPKNGIETFERYINRILGSKDSISLCSYLSFLIRMIKSYGIPVDYETLYTDIVYWGDRTKIKWACAYQTGSDKEVSDVSDKNNS